MRLYRLKIVCGDERVEFLFSRQPTKTDVMQQIGVRTDLQIPKCEVLVEILGIPEIPTERRNQWAVTHGKGGYIQILTEELCADTDGDLVFMPWVGRTMDGRLTTDSTKVQTQL